MSENAYLLNYLRDTGRIPSRTFDALRYEFDKYVYNYGDHFRNPYSKSTLSSRIRGEMNWFMRCVKRNRAGTKKADIQSNAYAGVDAGLHSLGYSTMPPPWYGSSVGRNITVLREVHRLQKVFAESSLAELLSSANSCLFDQVETVLRQYYSQFRALVVPYDIVFFENISIQLFREAGKPSFVFLHGLPGRYDMHDDLRADHLCVWGDSIRSNYIRAGGDPARIHVVGRPGNGGLPKGKRRFSFDDVLVITKSLPGGQPITGKTYIGDRGNLILYLYQVQDVLQSLGVNKARFRPHPSERGDWYSSFLDPAFYELDRCPMKDSLSSATLVIGPTSTMFLDSFMNGVEYVIYEPSFTGHDLINYPIVPPFDGSDERVSVANDPDELKQALIGEARTEDSLFCDYMGSNFNISFMKELIS